MQLVLLIYAKSKHQETKVQKLWKAFNHQSPVRDSPLVAKYLQIEHYIFLTLFFRKSRVMKKAIWPKIFTADKRDDNLTPLHV